MSRTTAARVLFPMAALTVLADALTTWAALTSWPSVLVETNPLWAGAVDAYGVPAAMALRTLSGVLVAWLLAVAAVRGYLVRSPTAPTGRLRRALRRGLGPLATVSARGRAALGALALLVAVTGWVAASNATHLGPLL